MNVTKSIKYAKYTMRVYSIQNKLVKEVTTIYFKNTGLKEIKEDLAKDALTLLEIVNTEYFTKKYSLEINKFIANATEIKEEKGE